jgi:hypothetical protein
MVVICGQKNYKLDIKDVIGGVVVEGMHEGEVDGSIPSARILCEKYLGFITSTASENRFPLAFTGADARQGGPVSECLAGHSAKTIIVTWRCVDDFSLLSSSWHSANNLASAQQKVLDKEDIADI